MLLRISLNPLLLAAVLTGCAGLFPPLYRSYAYGAGYSDVPVAKDTWEVSYVGPAEFSALQAEKMAVLRGAELTTISGHRWFRIVSREAGLRKTRKTTQEVAHAPVSDTSHADGPKAVTQTTTREEAWIPTATVVIAAQAAEDDGTLDAEAVLREGRASGLLPK